MRQNCQCHSGLFHYSLTFLIVQCRARTAHSTLLHQRSIFYIVLIAHQTVFINSLQLMLCKLICNVQ